MKLLGFGYGHSDLVTLHFFLRSAISFVELVGLARISEQECCSTDSCEVLDCEVEFEIDEAVVIVVIISGGDDDDDNDCWCASAASETEDCTEVGL